MPQELGYQSRVAPRGPAPLPQASPAAFGAGIGQGLSELGGAVHRTELREYQLEREQTRGAELSDAAARYAKLREDADLAEVDARATMAAGGKGYAEARAKWFDERKQGLLDGITEDSVRRQMSSQLDEFGGRLRSEAYQVEVGARIGKRTTDTVATMDIAANIVGRDPAKYEENLLATLTAIEGMDDVPADTRAKLGKLAEERLAIALLTKHSRDNPNTALALIASGAFDKTLSPEQLEQLRTRGEITVNRQRIEAERVEAKAAAVQKEREGTLLKQIGDGVEMDPSVLAGAAAAARARGDETQAYELETAAGAMKLTAPYAEANAGQLTAAIGEIERDAGWRRDPVKVRQHAWLDKRRTELRTADPAIAAPDWNDRASVTAFEAAARIDAEQRGAGAPTYLTRDMEATLKPMLGTLAGRGEALELLNRMTPEAAASAARQLAPDDHVFQGAATLSDPVRRMVLSGQEAMRSNTSPVTPTKSSPPFNSFALPALRGLQGDTGRTVKATADALAAELMQRRGETTFSPDIYREALHLSLGGGARGGQPTGGLGYWSNADGRGTRIVLPEAMTQREFDTKLARLSGPIDAYAGGKRISADDLRRHYTPVTVGEGRYEFEDAQGRALKAKNGTDAVFVLRNR